MSHLRPGLGDTVRAWFPYAGPWPASVTWQGAEPAGALEAAHHPHTPGEHRICADEHCVTVQVQPVRNRGPLGATARSRPLSGFRHRCEDRRYPRLAGAWLVGCGPGGDVDRALHLVSGEWTRLLSAGTAPGTGPGSLFATGLEGGLWRLPRTQPMEGLPPTTLQTVAPPATDGAHVALCLEDRVSLFSVEEATRYLHEARPVPWYPPGLAWPWMAWVDGRERRWTDTDIWVTEAGRSSRPAPLVRAPGDQRHVAGQGRWVGWVDDEGVWIEDLERGLRRHHRAETGFRAGLSLWGPVGCWEERNAGGENPPRSPTGESAARAPDIDIICSDGLRVEEPGDQGWPSRWGPWLVYRNGDSVRLATATRLVLDDDDPRAATEGTRRRGGYRGAHVRGTVRYRLDWPAPGWCWSTWDDTTWRNQGPLPVGEDIVLQSPGDAVALLPCAPPEDPPTDPPPAPPSGGTE